MKWTPCAGSSCNVVALITLVSRRCPGRRLLVSVGSLFPSAPCFCWLLVSVGSLFLLAPCRKRRFYITQKKHQSARRQWACRRRMAHQSRVAVGSVAAVPAANSALVNRVGDPCHRWEHGSQSADPVLLGPWYEQRHTARVPTAWALPHVGPRLAPHSRSKGNRGRIELAAPRRQVDRTARAYRWPVGARQMLPRERFGSPGTIARQQRVGLAKAVDLRCRD